MTKEKVDDSENEILELKEALQRKNTFLQQEQEKQDGGLQQRC